MTPTPQDRVPGVVDLVAIAQACAPIVEWYDAFLVDGAAALARQALARLDHDLARLRSLPRCSGKLGRAISVVANGPAAAGGHRTLAALETLRTTLALSGAHQDPPAPPALPAPPLLAEAPMQLSFGELESDDDPAP